MNKTFTLLLLFVCYTAWSQSDIQLDEAIVTTKFNTPKEESAQAIYTITAEEIQLQPATTVSSLLNQLPNVHIQEANGNYGSVQSYSIRGGRTKDVLILINGIPMSDDSNITQSEDLNLIPAERVEKIEIIAGGSSTIYGASASAGVINIILKDIDNQPRVNAGAEFGKWNTQRYYAQLNAKSANQKWGTALNLSQFKTDGFSAAADSLGTNNFVDDAGNRENASLQIQYKPNSQFNVSLTGALTNNDYDYDGGAYFDADNNQDNYKKNVELRGNYNHNKGKLTLLSAYNDYSRKSFTPFGAGMGNQSNLYEANNFVLDAYNTLDILDNSSLLTGLYYKNAKSDEFNDFSGSFAQAISRDSANFNLVDPYVALNINELNNIQFSTGARYHTHSKYDSKFVYHVNALGTIATSATTNLQLKAGINSAYITPSLYQLYSSFGSQELTPEESTNYEAGFVFGSNLANLEFNTFVRKENNLIGFSNTTFAYANLDGESEAKGFEINGNATVANSIKLNAFFAKTSRDKVADFYRLPENEFGLNASTSFMENTTLAINYRHAGMRVMPLFNNQTYETDEFNTDAYNMLNATATHNINIANQDVRIFGAVNNILNDDIIDNLGYNGASTNASIGLQLQLN